jgi:hypothetical protein
MPKLAPRRNPNVENYPVSVPTIELDGFALGCNISSQLGVHPSTDLNRVLGVHRYSSHTLDGVTAQAREQVLDVLRSAIGSPSGSPTGFSTQRHVQPPALVRPFDWKSS